MCIFLFSLCCNNILLQSVLTSEIKYCIDKVSCVFSTYNNLMTLK